MENAAGRFGSDGKAHRVQNWERWLGFLVLTEKRFAVKLENTVRASAPDRHTPRIQIRKISPVHLVLTGKRLAFRLLNITRNFGSDQKRHEFKLGNIARNFGPDRKTPRIQIGKNRQEFLS